MSDETADNKNLYKYRVGNSWFTFDKSILEPEDLRVFELADWKDKLKIITIYKDLKHTDDDDVVILRTKTEAADKDVRRRQYIEQKDALENEIAVLNEKQNKELEEAATEEQVEEINNRYESQISAINKKLAGLDTMFFDVIGVKRIDALDSAKSNKLILNNVKNILEGADKTLKELKTSLLPGDFIRIENIISKAINSTTQKEFADNTKEAKIIVEKLEKTTTQQEQKQQLNKINKTLEDFEKIAENKPVNFIVENVIDDKSKSTTYLGKVEEFKNDIPNVGLSDEEMKILDEYKTAITLVKGKTHDNSERVAFSKNIANLIMLYKEAFKYSNRYNFAIYDDKKPPKLQNVKLKNTTKEKEIYTIKELLDEFAIYKVLDVSNFYIYQLTKIGRDIYNLKTLRENGFSLSYLNDGDDTYNIIDGIVNNKIAGFLGLKTAKSARQDFEKLISRITDLENKIQQLNEEIKQVKQVKQEQAKPIYETVKPVVSRPQETNFLNDITQSKPQLKPVVSRPQETNFLNDITQSKPQLKHIELIKQAPELTELQKTFIKRREQMGYTDDDDDITVSDDEVWADGVDDSDLRGGLLEELVEDLKRYGLALSLAPDEKAYFLNVYEKGKTKPRRKGKKAAAGVAEADTLVKSVNQDTEYKDLKQLYEQLY